MGEKFGEFGLFEFQQECLKILGHVYMLNREQKVDETGCVPVTLSMCADLNHMTVSVVGNFRGDQSLAFTLPTETLAQGITIADFRAAVKALTILVRTDSIRESLNTEGGTIRVGVASSAEEASVKN